MRRLRAKNARHHVGAEIVDQQERVAAVLAAGPEHVAVHVLAGDRQLRQAAEQPAAGLGQHGGIVGADVVGRGIGVGGEGVEAHGEDAELSGRARRFVEERGVGVEAGGARLVDVADALGIAAVGGEAGVVLDVGGRVVAVLEAGEDFLGRRAELDAEVIDELEPAIGIDLRVERELGIGGSAADQRAAGIVADAADDRGADAG